MKGLFLLLVASLIVLNEVDCFHRPHHRKRSKTLVKRVPISKPPLSGVGDRETLKEALKLLNVGKKTLGLNTEDPDLLLQLVENPNEKNKSESIEKLLEDPKQIPHAPIGKQYLELSGDNGKVRVDNFTNVTPSPGEKDPIPSNDSDIQDVFKMIMEKKAPEAQSKVFHKITIIETNQLKPYSNKKPFQTTKSFKRRRRHKGWRGSRKLHIHPHIRQKRSRFASRLNFFHRKHAVNSDETPLYRKQILKRSNNTNWRDNVDSRIEISLSKLPDTAHINKRIHGSKAFREPENNIFLKEFFPSDNDSLQRKENSKHDREKLNIADNNLRFGAENLEKLIDSIEFESSLKTLFAKTTSKAIVTEVDLISTVPSKKPSIATTRKTAGLDRNTVMPKRDIPPSLDKDRYAVVERIIPLELAREPMLSHVLEVAAIMFITLLCFIIILIVHSKLYKVTPTASEKTTKKMKDQMTWKNQNNHNKICPYNGMHYYKMAALGEDDSGLLNMEWQSESGDWLTEIDEKAKL